MLRRPALPYLLSADGGGGADGPAAGASAGSVDAGSAGQAAAGVTFATQAEFDAAVKAQVEAATASTRAQVEAWQKTALDSVFAEVYREHGIAEDVRELVRSQWEATKPGEDGHRPDPKAWLPEQKWFKALKPAPAAPVTRTRTGKSEPAPGETPATPGAPPATATPPQAPAVPPYLLRGPGSAAAPSATKPAATYAEAARVLAQQFRATP